MAAIALFSPVNTTFGVIAAAFPAEAYLPILSEDEEWNIHEV